MNIINYKILMNDSPITLEKLVRATLKDWQPVGGVVVYNGLYCQSMVSYTIAPNENNN